MKFRKNAVRVYTFSSNLLFGEYCPGIYGLEKFRASAVRIYIFGNPMVHMYNFWNITSFVIKYNKVHL